jgi:hypothetical protein
VILGPVLDSLASRIRPATRSVTDPVDAKEDAPVSGALAVTDSTRSSSMRTSEEPFDRRSATPIGDGWTPSRLAVPNPYKES